MLEICIDSYVMNDSINYTHVCPIKLVFYTRYKQLTYLKEALGSWEKSGRRTLLLELLSSELKNASEIKGTASSVSPACRGHPALIVVFFCCCVVLFSILVCEDDRTGFHNGSSEMDDPGKIKESRRLAAYVERFPNVIRTRL